MSGFTREVPAMSENMEKFRHLDGSEARVERPFINVVFQHGHPNEVGVNGCRIEDLIDVAVDKLLAFQGRDLSCAENSEALEHLYMAREALLKRRRKREQQGVLWTQKPHESGDLLGSAVVESIPAVALV
jgi:hypothetical protein